MLLLLLLLLLSKQLARLLIARCAPRCMANPRGSERA
jgi:hypothetical protein